MPLPRSRLHSHLISILTVLSVAAPQVNSAIVIRAGININIPSTASGVYLNVVTGALGTSAATAPQGWDINPWGSTSLSMFTPTPSPGGGAYVGSGTNFNNLAPGFLVGPSQTYCAPDTATINPATPLNPNSSNNIFGFRFVNEANGNEVHYGWFRVSLSSPVSAQPRTIIEYGYQDLPGVAAGFPSPGTASTLGSLAFLTLRRRR